MSNIIIDIYECDCSCHKTEDDEVAQSHDIPCCEICSLCGKRIKYGCIELHCKKYHSSSEE